MNFIPFQQIHFKFYYFEENNLMILDVRFYRKKEDLKDLIVQLIGTQSFISYDFDLKNGFQSMHT